MRPVVKRHIWIIAGYLLLTGVMAWPVVATINSHVAGVGGDPWQTMWRFEHKLTQLTNQGLPFLADELLGKGPDRLVNLSVWPWMPLHAIFGQPLAYNLVWLLSFVLSGYGMYLLTSYLLHKSPKQQITNNKPWLREAPAWLAGVIYMFLPYHVAHAQGHFGAMQLQWLPLIILVALKWYKKPTFFKTIGLGLLVAVQAWSEHHYVLWLALLVIWAVIWFWGGVKEWGSDTRRLPWSLWLLALLVVLVVLPYGPTIRLAMQGDSSLQLGAEQTIRFSADPFAYLSPPLWQPIWGGLSHTLFGKNFTGNLSEATQFLGLVSILLVLFWHEKIPERQKKWWGWTAALFLIISLGPRLHLMGKVTGLPLPWALVDSWPVFSSVRAVARAGVMVGLAWSVLVAFVLKANLKRWTTVVIILLVVLLEFLFIPVPVISAELPAAYRVLKDLPGDMVLEIPAATNYSIASRALNGTILHGKEVVGSIALERALDDEVLTEIRSLPALRQLLYLRTTHLLEKRADFFEQSLTETWPDVMEWLGAKHVLVHVDSLSTGQLQAVRGFLEDDMGLSGQLVDDVWLYELAVGDEIKETDDIFMSRDGAWQNVGYDEERQSVFAEVPVVASTTLYNVAENTQVVELAYSVPAESHDRLEVWRGNEKLQTIRLNDGRYVVRIVVQPGKTTLRWINKGEEKAIIQNPSMKAYEDINN